MDDVKMTVRRKQAIKKCRDVVEAGDELWEALIDNDVNDIAVAYQVLIDAMGWLKSAVYVVEQDEKADRQADPAIAESVSGMSAAIARSLPEGRSVTRTHALGSRRI